MGKGAWQGKERGERWWWGGGVQYSTYKLALSEELERCVESVPAHVCVCVCCFIYAVNGWSLTSYVVITIFPTVRECSKRAPGDGAEAEKRQGAASIVSYRRRTERCENIAPLDGREIIYGDGNVLIMLLYS